MTGQTITAWESELKVLLEQIRSHPSADLAQQRERVVLLEKLIADFRKNETA